MNLFITLYDEKDKDRLGELMECYAKNKANPFIKKIFILNEGLELMHEPQLRVNGRTTYSSIFSYINSVSYKQDVNIIANSDIYFDETIELAKYIKPNECYALCRQEMPQNYKGGSQDVWIFRGRIRPTLKANFPIGFPGCDNRLAFVIDKAGYEVKNPCEQILCWHNHKSEEGGNWYHSPEAAEPIVTGKPMGKLA